MEPSEQVCLACGLCCDGTLFGHVRLRREDDAKRLKALGLPVFTGRGRESIVRMRQPCEALCHDRTCRIYDDRPSQCRAYECGVFQGLGAGRIEFEKAMRLVTQARRKASRVRALLRKLGETDESRSLDERFRRAQRRMESGAVDPAEAGVFADLTLAVHRLDLLAHEVFYTRVEAKDEEGNR